MSGATRGDLPNRELGLEMMDDDQVVLKSIGMSTKSSKVDERYAVSNLEAWTVVSTNRD